MKKILWLTSWYPNATDAFHGDFIKREAEAVALLLPLKVLYVVKNQRSSLSEGNHYSDVHHTHQNPEEHILYYSSIGNDQSVVSRVKSIRNYIRRNLEFIKQLRTNGEMPDLIHVQVAMKAGLIALFLKWKYRIPYVLTEHWSGYYPFSADSLYKKSYLTRFATRLIIKNAARFLPVSEDLGKQITDHWAHVSFQKIPNVVNTALFYAAENAPSGVFRFVHVSSLKYPKNPEGILRAFMALQKQGIQAELVLIGPLNPSLNELIKTSGLRPDQIHCTGEVPYDQVAIELRNSSSLVMFSFYENMPCAILEALCSGLPVIATRVGGIPEIIKKENGILINAGDESALCDAMKEIILSYAKYDRKKISRDATGQFSYQVIGKSIVDVYDSVLK